MAVFIYEPDAFRRLVLVEGEDYARDQSEYGVSSFESFLQEWCRSVMCEPDFTDFDWPMSVDGNAAIYGRGGWHRYTVRNTGEIFFIKGFCHHRKCLPLARSVGFRIFPDDLL